MLTEGRVQEETQNHKINQEMQVLPKNKYVNKTDKESQVNIGICSKLQLCKTSMYVVFPIDKYTPHSAQEKTKAACANECECMDEHMHTESNVNTAIVYDTHTHTHQFPNKAWGLRLNKKPSPGL